MNFVVEQGKIRIFRGVCLVVFNIFSFLSYAQNCICPALGSCSPCSGGLTSLTLRYDGPNPAIIEVSDQMGSVFSGAVNPGSQFSFTGSIANGKFTGTQIEIMVNNELQTVINVSCTGLPTLVGNVYGDFMVLAGLSFNGGTICCSQNFIEKTPPVINNCPDDLIISLTENACTAVVTWTPPIASDNCEMMSLTANHASGESFPIGDTEVVYLAVDIYGNESTCSFNVSIVNSTAPQVTDCPEKIRLEADENEEVIVHWDPPVVSACSDVTITQTHEPGSTFSVGVTPVTYSFTDQQGNTATCTFEVEVFVADFPLEINKAVTPDGDGIQDTWVINNIEKYESNEVIIVDRWGNTIFSATGYNNTSIVWRGLNSHGHLVPTGTYFYSIQLQGKSRIQNKTGFIEVVR